MPRTPRAETLPLYTQVPTSSPRQMTTPSKRCHIQDVIATLGSPPKFDLETHASSNPVPPVWEGETKAAPNPRFVEPVLSILHPASPSRKCTSTRKHANTLEPCACVFREGLADSVSPGSRCPTLWPTPVAAHLPGDIHCFQPSPAAANQGAQTG